MLREWLSKCRAYLRGRSAIDTELQEEMQAHLEFEIEESIDKGETQADARRRFGNTTLIRESAASAWGFAGLDATMQDLRFGFRQLRRTPGFTAIAIATLGLGIGMSTAVFSVMNAVLLRSLSYPEADRLVSLATYDPAANEDIVPRFDFRSWKTQARSFDRMVAYSSGDVTVAAGDRSLQARVASVSPDFWEISGARPMIGRLPDSGEQNVVMLSHALFEQVFGGDPAFVGKIAMLDGQPVTVAGVLPGNFRFQLVPPPRRDVDSKDVAAYVPLEPAPQDYTRSRGRTVTVVGRLKSDVGYDQARHELEAIRFGLAQGTSLPYLDRMQLRMAPLKEKLTSEARKPLWVLVAAVICVLLIACANIASLLLARATARQKEIAIRAAIGAGRTRLLRQLLVESLLLAILGAAVGVALAQLGLTAILSLAPHSIPRLSEVTLDASAFVFALAISVVTALLFGLAPFLTLSKVNAGDAMRNEVRTASPSSLALRTRKLLVVAQLSLAVALLSGAGALLKSFSVMSAHPPGFDPDQILVMKIPLSGPGYAEAEKRHALVRELLESIGAVPGVRAIGVVPNYPIKTGLTVQGARPQLPGEVRPPTTLKATSAGYIKAIGVKLLAGRWITDTEPASVVVINESLARREFGGQDPIGKGIMVQAILDGKPKSFAPVVGIVADVKDSKLDSPPEAQVYVPYSHVPIGSGVTVLARVSGDPLAVVPTMLKLIAELDKTQAVYAISTLEVALAGSVAPRRFTLFLFGTFAVLALLLGTIGIYGVISYAVAQRTHEIGIRIALGASRATVARMVLIQALGLTVCGVILGLGGAIMLTRAMSGLLYEVQPGDLGVFAAAVALLSGTALTASLAPALRAARLDPVASIRA